MTKPYRGIGPIDRALREAAIETAEEVGMQVVGEAQRTAPKDEGTLRERMDWEVDAAAFRAGGSGRVEARIYNELPYAAVQHERTDFHHDVGKAKYIEDPLRSESGKVAARLAAKAKQRLRSNL